MSKRDDNESRFSNNGLRKNKQHLLEDRLNDAANLSSTDPQKLIEELHTHQIELEMQNDELRAMRNILEKTQEKYHNLFNLAPVGYMVCNCEGGILETNKALCEMLGVGKNQLVNTAFSRFIAPEYRDTYYLHIKKVLEHDDKQTCDLELSQDNGTTLIANIVSNKERHEDGVLSIRSAVINITERKQTEEKLKHIATHDPLTGIYNRNEMKLRLNNEIKRASRYKRTLSIFMLDLDYFKSVNDTYGHQAGDTVLRNFAKILENSIRNTDFVARYGGEEFVVILPETRFPKAKELAERLRKKIIKNPFKLEDGKELKITASIGIATFPKHAKTRQKLLKAADSAMYAAKKAGRNQAKSP